MNTNTNSSNQRQNQRQNPGDFKPGDPRARHAGKTATGMPAVRKLARRFLNRVAFDAHGEPIFDADTREFITNLELIFRKWINSDDFRAHKQLLEVAYGNLDRLAVDVQVTHDIPVLTRAIDYRAGLLEAFSADDADAVAEATGSTT